MRGLRRWGRAAALMALAVFAWGMIRSAAQTHGARPALVIEVIDQEAEPAAAQALTGQPRVLIYHTHTWEAYEMTEDAQYTPTETWRTMDERFNMVRIGRELAAELTSRGFYVVHDTTAFEPPNLSAAYTRSLAMLDERLGGGEAYDYIIDLHRDAYSGPYNGGNWVSAGEREMAYVMMLVGKGTGATGSGFDERPDWPKNLALAEQITQEMETLVPGIAREVKIKTGRFNQHVSSGAMLIEIGNNRNTLDQALASCPVVAEAIARVYESRSSAQE
ncbi:MAG: stage II sporulation protein P [Clostridia bacterium]|nr:stage II sporulation protein P [Clostridia bacterium]